MKKRNITLEFFKLFAALAVVAIHVNLVYVINDSYAIGTSTVSDIFRFATRFAVPMYILTSGYFWHNHQNQKVFSNLLKLQVFMIILFAITNFCINIYSTTAFNAVFYVNWYFMAMFIIYFLTYYQNKFWLFSLLIIGVLINILNGYFFDNGMIYEVLNLNDNTYFVNAFNYLSSLVSVGANTAIVYMPIFILGMLFSKYKFKLNKNILLTVILLILFIVGSYLNVTTWHLEQQSLYADLMAIILFSIAMMYPYYSANKLATNLNLDIFLYHTLVLGVVRQINLTYDINTYLIVLYVLVILFTIILRVIIRYIDKNVLNSFIYGN